MTELLNEKRWNGVFFQADSYDKRFCGEIHYSPEKGIILSYSITEHEVLPDSEFLWGILSTGAKCTLFGQFTSRNSGLTFDNGLITRPGKAGFLYLIIGDFIKQEEKFSKINFTLSNMQEFFFASGNKASIKLSKKPLYQIKSTFGCIEINNIARLDNLNNNDLYCDNTEAIDQLIQAIKDIKENYPDSEFLLKKDISYQVDFKFEPELSISDAYEYINIFSNLIALLIFNPVYPEKIEFIKQSPKGHPTKIKIFPSMLLDPRTLNLSLRNHFHHNMPITQHKIDFESVMAKWQQEHHNHLSIITSIQHETGFRNLHTLHGEIVLYATQFESISYSANQKKDVKYEYTLKVHSTENIHAALAKIFSKSTVKEVAKAIGELRDEITHVQKPKNWLNKLSTSELIKISQYLQLTIIGYTLNKIGIPLPVIQSYQNRLFSTN